MTTTEAATRFWDGHYRTPRAERRPNSRLTEIAANLSPGTALDLGCGEGGDALWLARRGWHVTAVDLSGVVIARLAERARAAGLAGRSGFGAGVAGPAAEASAGLDAFSGSADGIGGDRRELGAESPAGLAGEVSAGRGASPSEPAGRVVAERHDLGATFPAGRFDLVSAHYLHTSFALPRARVLRRAAMALVPGGRLVVVDHGSVAPWSWNQDPDTVFPSAREVADELELDPGEWTVERAEALTRRATGPGGRRADVVDHLLLIRRAR